MHHPVDAGLAVRPQHLVVVDRDPGVVVGHAPGPPGPRVMRRAPVPALLRIVHRAPPSRRPAMTLRPSLGYPGHRVHPETPAAPAWCAVAAGDEPLYGEGANPFRPEESLMETPTTLQLIRVGPLAELQRQGVMVVRGADRPI